MTVELRTLRVAAEMDPAKYVAGAQSVQTANRGMVSSNREASAAVTDVEQKITRSVTGFDALELRVSKSAREARAFGLAMGDLSRAMDKEIIGSARLATHLDALYQKYGMTATASQFAAKGQLQLAAAVDQANTRFAAQNRPQPVNPSLTPPANQNNAPVDRMGQFRRQNLGYQILDSGQGLALGMNPAMVLMQQGPQVLQLYAGQGGLNAALKDFSSIVMGAAQAVAPFAAAGVVAYGAYKLLASYSVEAGLAVSETTKALAAQAEPISTLKGQIEELKAVQEQYSQAIISTADYSTTATNTIIANSEREFNAKKALLELEQKRQRASIEVARAELEIQSIRLKSEVSQQVFTNPNLVAGGYADPRIGSVPFVRLPDEVTGLEKTNQVINDSPLADKIKEMRANLELTEMAARKLDEALKQTFDQAPYLVNSDGRRVAVPVPAEKPIQLGIADKPESDTKKAYEGLIKNANDRIEQMKLEAQTAGQTGIAAQRLTFELGLLQKAQDKGRTASEKQRLEISKLAEEFERVATAAAKAKLNSDLDWEFSQAGRTSSQQNVASRLRGAGLPVDFASEEANRMQLLEQRTQTREALDGFFTDFGHTLLQNGGDLGDALGKALANAAMNAAQKAWDRLADMLSTMLTNALFGTPGNTPAVQTAGGNILGAITGGAPQAANSNVVTGGIAAANNNSDIASYIAKAASQRGIDPSVALSVARSEGGLSSWNRQSDVIKNGMRERSFGPYQLYMDGGLGNEFMAKTGLDPALATNGPAGVDFALDSAKQNGWGAWYGAGNAGIGNWEGIGTAGEAAQQFADATGAATKNVGAFGSGMSQLSSGLGQMGSALSSMQLSPLSGSAVGQNSGLWGGIGKLLGGISPTSSLWAPNTTFGSFIGAFADGTESAPGGLAMVGERGRELVNLPRGSQVIPNHRAEGMLNQRGESPSPGKDDRVLNVHINGASGDPHVRELVRQGVQEALAAKAEQDRRGGWGQMQARYNNQRA